MLSPELSAAAASTVKLRQLAVKAGDAALNYIQAEADNEHSDEDSYISPSVALLRLPVFVSSTFASCPPDSH